MQLSGNYTGRSGKFNYLQFVRDSLDALDGESANKTSLFRSAVSLGAEEKSPEKIISKLSESLNTVANIKGYTRHKIKEEKGYFFRKDVNSANV